MGGWRRWAGWAAAAGVLVAGGAAVAGWLAARPPGRPPDTILVVVDTLRADRTHLCGYALPTTPVMDRLAADGWAWTCDALSPASWTIPSHLALFTGTPYLELRERTEEPVSTLADRFQARGYDTALLSANMVLRKDDRLAQGFRQVRTAKHMAELKGQRFAPALEEVLDGLDPTLPAFLFVNLVDAHSPYLAVPAGLGWLPAQPGVQTKRFGKDQDAPFARFMSGRMEPDERAAYERALSNGYDYGVHLADRNLGVLLDALAARGRLDHARVVVTSDHGELLGEHDAIGHGDTLYEPGLRVPLLFRDTSRPRAELPPGTDVMQAAHLLLEGAPGPTPTQRFVTNHVFRFEDAWTAVALWAADGSKLVWRDGERFRFDLSRDPEERTPLPVDGHPEAAALDALAERLQRIDGAALDPETEELLEAAGYLDPGR